ncbi:MAG: radical SAM protein [Rhodospirillales bacterium]|nr:radical SAM protein [Rhodospirillales bacterium]MDH3917893.1 radical SAM protein [Rhodospirillales bacterium]MDH3967583.1 radical SAM protein [Rhodospirillales bacterium]
MLREVHILLTYSCNFECDHCFLYCGPKARGTFTRAQIAEVLEQAKRLGTVEWIYFEGGEPFLFYSLMIEGLDMARALGFKTGIVTNGSWATTEADAELWLEPLSALEVADLSMSDDWFHGGERGGRSDPPVKTALRVARRLGLPVDTIRIERPASGTESAQHKGATIVGGEVRFRGRAADRLTDGLPRQPAAAFTECPYEDLQTPERVHVDCHGNVHVCQGLTIGSIWDTRLPRLLAEYRAEAHPVCGPLVEGGPARLAEVHGIAPEAGPADACHLCFQARRALIDRFPEYLTPRQVYGLD